MSQRTYKSVMVRSNLEQVSANIKAQAKVTAEKIAKIIKDRVIAGFQEPKSGRWYPLPGYPGRKYQASATEEYPAIVTRALIDSLYSSTAVYQDGRIRATVGARADHGKILEGTPSVRGMRPWLSKAYFDSLDKVEAVIYSDAWKAVGNVDMDGSGSTTTIHSSDSGDA